MHAFKVTRPKPADKGSTIPLMIDRVAAARIGATALARKATPGIGWRKLDTGVLTASVIPAAVLPTRTSVPVKVPCAKLPRSNSWCDMEANARSAL